MTVEACSYCKSEATDYYEFRTTFFTNKKGSIKPVCSRHLELLKIKEY